MARIITVNGLNFGVESDGWRSHEAERDEAIDNLEDALNAMPDAELAALHRALQAEGYPDMAGTLCYDAVRPVVADWHDPTAPALMLSAAG